MKTVQVWEALHGLMVAVLALTAHTLTTQLRPTWLFARSGDEKSPKAPFKL